MPHQDHRAARLPISTLLTIAFVVLIILVAAANAQGQSVTLPEEIKASPLQWVIVAPTKVDGGKVKWRADPRLQEVDLGGLLPAEFKGKLLGKVYTYNGSETNVKLWVEAWNAKKDVASEISVCWIVIGQPVPTPPDPPTPPVPPSPPDVFTQTVLTAFRNESPQDKAKVKVYAALYTEMAKTMLDPTVQPKFKTVKDVWSTLAGARAKLLSDASRPGGYLLAVGEALGTEFNRTLAVVESAPMSAAMFAQFASEFARAAKALEACK